MKHVILNAEGYPEAYYDDKIHLDIPSEAIEISDDVWQMLIDNNGAAKLIDGEVIISEPSLSDAKQIALEAVKHEHATRLNEFTGNATVEERDTWTVQLKAAETYLAGGNADDKAFLEGLLTDAEVAAIEAASGDKATEMANKIIAKADITKTLIKMAGKLKREAEHAIEATTTSEELNAVIEALKLEEAEKIAEFVALLSS